MSETDLERELESRVPLLQEQLRRLEEAKVVTQAAMQTEVGPLPTTLTPTPAPDLSPDRLAELLAKCEAATPGPWNSDSYRTVMLDNGNEIATTKRKLKDADHIAAFDPATAAALVREVLRLRKRIDAACDALCCCEIGKDEGCGCRSATLEELLLQDTRCDLLTVERNVARAELLVYKDELDKCQSALDAARAEVERLRNIVTACAYCGKSILGIDALTHPGA